jgi:hypothetical protein
VVLGCEGIVSKRLGSPYRAGRTDNGIKGQESGGAGRAALTCCVISRAREAEPSAGGNLAPAAERDAAFCYFGLSAVVMAAPAPAGSSTTSYRTGSRDRPIDRLVIWAVSHSFCVSLRARGGGPSASGFDPGGAELWGQALMVERNADVPPDRQMLFRIGVKLGDVLIDGEDILGDDVNIAARLEGVAEPGGVCISDDGGRAQ